jgi:hypothetical protein
MTVVGILFMSIRWIPAFAGMTVVPLIYAFGFLLLQE